MIKTLYKIDANGAVRQWTASVEGSTIVILHGLVGGKLGVTTDYIKTNQSGRTLEQQIALEVQSRINTQLDKGYCETIELAHQNQGLNAVGLIKPTLAHKICDVKDIDWSTCYMQYKYNGHRCLVTKKEGKVIAYSRNGKLIQSVSHITSQLQWLPEGATLDGELYHHGTPLQTIGSWIRKNQEDSKNLVYVVFDMVSDAPFLDRYARMACNIPTSQSLVIAPTYDFMASKTPLKERLAKVLDNGYEGLILRHGTQGYEVGKRSQKLVKVKQTLDDEFCIVAVHQSKDGWAIFECYKQPKIRAYIPGIDTFRVTAPGTHEEKLKAWEERNSYLGKMLTVEFFEWTNDKKPFHPVAIGLRVCD
jgi:DNA ligase 1